MARARPGGGARKPIPSWLLGSWKDRETGEASAYCRRHGIDLLTVIAYRAHVRSEGMRQLDAEERAEIATWELAD